MSRLLAAWRRVVETVMGSPDFDTHVAQALNVAHDAPVTWLDPPHYDPSACDTTGCWGVPIVYLYDTYRWVLVHCCQTCADELHSRSERYDLVMVGDVA